MQPYDILVGYVDIFQFFSGIILAVKKRHAVSLCGVLLAAARSAIAQTSFTNPIAASGADPWVQLYNGTYYYTDTTGGNVSVAASSTLPGIGSAAMTSIYTPPSGGGNVWAPELHYINGSWYAYYSMTTSTSDHRMYVLQSNSSNPQGSYTYKGQITDPTNDWAIDGTVLTLSNGSLYFIWSGWPGSSNGIQNLYIAPMSNPWTISGNRVLISSPTNSWEQQGGPPSINEGPEILTSSSGTTSLIYSASGSWTDNYCLGEITLTGSDPLNPASWTKNNSGPVFASANNVFGPGHASFTTSDNGTRNWIVYHAAVSSGAGWNRNIRTQPFSWNPDGTPSFGQPVPVTVPIQWGPTSWVGAINESPNDSAHAYLNTGNWVGGTINDSFANVTLTDNTTLYFIADRTTAGNMVFTYGSGQKTLTLESSSTSNHTLTLTGSVQVNILGGANSLYFGSASNPLSVAMGSAQTNFNIASANSLYIDSNLTGTAGLNVSGGGMLVLRGAKTYLGPTVVSNGTLAAGDGNSPSSTANLPASTVVQLSANGTLQLNGVNNSSSNSEIVAGLTGTGNVTGPANTVSLTLANTAACTFYGSVSGANLSLVEAGPSTETLAGTSNYGGSTIVTGGTLNVQGSETGMLNLFVKQGSASIATGGVVTTTSFVSVGQSAGDSGTLNVRGSLTVPSDFNSGDVSSTGVTNIFAGASVACRTLYVGKYATANGTVNQMGGSVSALSNGVDWRIGGANSGSDSAAVGLYNLSAGTLNTGVYNFQIGAYGSGTLIQTGGTVTSGGYLSIGRFPGGVGVFNISGGSLTETAQPQLIVGEQGNGKLIVSANGTVNAANLSIALNGGVGVVNQTGGTINASTGVTLAQNIGGSATYFLSGGVLNAASIKQGLGSGTFDLNGGVLSPTAGTSSFLQGISNVNVQAGGAIFNTSGFAITVNQPLTHDPLMTGADGGLLKLGAGTLTIGGLESYSGNTTVSSGTLVFAPNTGSVILVRPVGSLSVAAGGSLIAGSATTASGIARTLLVAQTNVSVAGTLDLGVNDLDVKNGNVASLTTVLQSGYGNGKWLGSGIVSSAAAANASHLTALGIAQNSNSAGTLYSTFDTQTASASDVLIKYTYYGDANLDGSVDGSDYSLIDNGFLTGSTGWFNGDFNYDGVIDGSDYTLIDNGFNMQSAAISDQIMDSSVEIAAQIATSTSVPEPMIPGLLAFGTVGLLGRRRKRRPNLNP